jgi:hypothetical protein
MDTLLETAARILEIESRQDDALRQLAELERQIAQLLAEFLPAPAQGASDAVRSLAPRATGVPPVIKAA